MLRAEQEHLQKYYETGVIPAEFIYLVWRDGTWPRKGEPKTLEVKLKPRFIKHRTKYRPAKKLINIFGGLSDSSTRETYKTDCTVGPASLAHYFKY